MSMLTDKTAIITGASSGIGEATAIALAGSGVAVVLAARRIDRLDALVEKITDSGDRAAAVECDVTNRNHVQRVTDTALDKFGGIDILINNAGIMPVAPMVKCRLDDWADTIDVNLKGALYCIGNVLPVFVKQGSGHIVNVSSVAGRRVFPGAAVYSGTKFALHAISEGLRYELAEQAKEDNNRIRITIIAPGVVATEMPDSIRDEETRELSKRYYAALRDPLQSEDIATSIVYALEAPPHVNVNEIVIRPTSQVK